MEDNIVSGGHGVEEKKTVAPTEDPDIQEEIFSLLSVRVGELLSKEMEGGYRACTDDIYNELSVDQTAEFQQQESIRKAKMEMKRNEEMPKVKAKILSSMIGDHRENFLKDYVGADIHQRTAKQTVVEETIRYIVDTRQIPVEEVVHAMVYGEQEEIIPDFVDDKDS